MVGEQLDVDVTLSNTGGFYGGPFTLHVFQSGGNQHVGRGSHDIFLDGGQSLSFNLQVNTENIPEGEYFMQAFLGNTLISYDQFKFNVVSTGTIQVDSPEGFDVLCLPDAFQVPCMMKCGVVTAADTENMKIDYRYETGDVVPAGTPLIVCVDSPGNYPYKWVNSTAAKPPITCCARKSMKMVIRMLATVVTGIMDLAGRKIMRNVDFMHMMNMVVLSCYRISNVIWLCPLAMALHIIRSRWLSASGIW